MLSEDKIKKMIRLSDYENGLGSMDFRRTHYLKTDYVRLQVIKTVLSITVAVFLTVFLIGLYQYDDIMYRTFLLPWRRWLMFGGVTWGLLLIAGVAVTVIRAARLYDESLVRVKEYHTTLQELLELYEEEQQGQEEETT